MSALPAPFLTLAAPHRHGEVVQGSEFLAFAARADTPEEALAQLTACRQRYPDATHHTWAYRIGPAYRFSDDGEPGGTAGQPILKAIEGQGLDHVMVVVVRYYGGVKLGTGGLMRAYGGAAAECLRLAPKEQVRPRQGVRVRLPFASLSALYHLLGRYDALRGEEEYTAQGAELDVSLFPEDVEDFSRALQDATRGAAAVEPVGE